VVDKNPAATDTRAKLIASYSSAAGDKAENRAARLRPLMWLAKNQPQAGLCSEALVFPHAPGDSLQDDEGYKALNRMWLDRTSGPVLLVQEAANTCKFLRLVGPEATEKMPLSLTNKSDLAETWLADLYALTALRCSRRRSKKWRGDYGGQEPAGRRVWREGTADTAIVRTQYSLLLYGSGSDDRRRTLLGPSRPRAQRLCGVLSETAAERPVRLSGNDGLVKRGPEAAKEDVPLLRIGGTGPRCEPD
jgi:hypothetical protein